MYVENYDVNHMGEYFRDLTKQIESLEKRIIIEGSKIRDLRNDGSDSTLGDVVSWLINIYNRIGEEGQLLRNALEREGEKLTGQYNDNTYYDLRDIYNAMNVLANNLKTERESLERINNNITYSTGFITGKNKENRCIDLRYIAKYLGYIQDKLDDIEKRLVTQAEELAYPHSTGKITHLDEIENRLDRIEKLLSEKASK